MIADLKRYEAYQDSGAPWLGEIPRHWGLLRMKTLLRERSQKGFPKEPLLAATQTRGVIRKDQYESRTVLALNDLQLLKFVKIGDFVISLRSFQGGIEYSRAQGIISPAYTILYPTNPSVHGFLAWLFKSKPYVENLSLFVTGIRQGQSIDYEKLSRSALPVPPLPEQATIVRFLNLADRRIQRYIRAKKKLIALLNDQKQAIIHRAVTLGLDPNVRLKPSGLEWLGEVPEHWEVRRVKQVSQILRGKFSHRPRNDQSFYDGLYPFIQTGEVARSAKVITDFRQTLNERGFAVSKLFPAGTLVMTIAANIGDVAVLDFAACFPDSIVGFVPHVEAERDFLYFVFLAMRAELLREAPVNTQGNLNVDRIGAMMIPLPSLFEQQGIVHHVERNMVELDLALERALKGIDLLREYRTGLIADVVTGKLDVREAAAQLPEELEEAEPLDIAEADAEAEELDGLDAEEGTE